MYFIPFLFMFIFSLGSNNVIITNVDVDSLQLGSSPPSETHFGILCEKGKPLVVNVNIFYQTSICKNVILQEINHIEN